MRHTRRLLLVVLLTLVGAVAVVYQKKAVELKGSEPPAPKPIQSGFQATNSDWVLRKDDGKCPLYEVHAKEFRQVDDPDARIHLTGVRLQLFHKCGAEYDLVLSESAVADTTKETLFSEGDVEITLAVPVDESKKARLLAIRTSGVHVEIRSGKATTDKPVRFSFDLGDGEATGATYEPQTRHLTMHSNVKLRWLGKDPHAKPMFIEAGRLVYPENESKVYLSPWAKFRRDNLNLDSADAVITLEAGNIRLVEAQRARGTDQYPNRALAFGADAMVMQLTSTSQVENIKGNGHAKLQAESNTAQTDIETATIELDFETAGKESILKTATALGNTVVQSNPAARAGQMTPPMRVVRSEHVVARMRPGGEEMEIMETHSAGTLDLLPNHPSQPRRHLQADRMWLHFGGQNQLEKFRAVNVTTTTHKPLPASSKSKKELPPVVTSSKDLNAHFDPSSGDMIRLEQWTDFRYKEGEREASAVHAMIEARTDVITLDQSARVWDPGGSVSANRIAMNQNTGDFTAEGKVASTRRPERKQTASSTALLSQDEPVKATAARMISTSRNQHIVYEGDAVLWQSGNRLQAERVVIDRTAQTLSAQTRVVSQFQDKKQNPRTRRLATTIVHASGMTYSDRDRVAVYQGPVRLLRDGMDVKSKNLRAWLNEDTSAESSLNRAFADGDVEIFQAEGGRTRLGLAQHAEYYVAEEKVLLNGGMAQFRDSLKGSTRGHQIQWFARTDSLEVDGEVTQPTVNRFRRK